MRLEKRHTIVGDIHTVVRARFLPNIHPMGKICVVIATVGRIVTKRMQMAAVYMPVVVLKIIP